ncbi:unnamed protein product [Lactuca saligna]|uniref:PGG domain-containing protein n=1 Tax=Lactuca saligna TaxID=75948 RepID=A0AA36E8G5_LACSI|nr:unnamed protein product [Lactuca saligna]
MLPPPGPPPPPQRQQSTLITAGRCCRQVFEYFIKKIDDPMAERKADALLVAASVLAAMNYQAAISPPGGAYQDTRSVNGKMEYQAGQAIAAYVAPYKLAMEATTPDHDELKARWKFINRLVTGALITWCVLAGTAIVFFVGTLLKPLVTAAYGQPTLKT